MAGAAWGRRVLVGLGVALACATLAPAARSAGDRPKTIYHKGRSFRVPFNVDKADRPRLQEIQLWVSQDQGQQWELYKHVAPDQPSFSFQSTQDGEYWFTVRTKDTQGVLHPSDEQDVTPGLAVIVDTTPPTIAMSPLPRRGSRATVTWTVLDKYPDPASLVLEYQAEGAQGWRRVPNARPSLEGKATWDAGTADAVKVRATVADRAGNRGVAELSLPEGTGADAGQARGTDPSGLSEPPPILAASDRGRGRGNASEPEPIAEGPADPAPHEDSPAPADPADAPTLVVGGLRFPLQYAVDDAGDSGPETVELWITADRGQTWTMLGRDPDRKSPFPVNFESEGTFGLKLVARGASGLGDPRPAPGEAPQTWVVVDMTEPAIRLDPPRVNPETGKLTITWKATDPHLGPRPVVLSYRDRPDSIWQEIAKSLPNSGRYDWTLPPNVAPRFQIRIDVLDTLDNRGTAESAPVIVNRARPKSRIIGLDPSARANGRALR